MWTNDLWPLVIKAYLSAPTGPKSNCSRPVVDLAMQLHMKPADIVDRLKTVDAHKNPMVERLLVHYQAHPKKLKRDAERLAAMSGFGNSGAFYDGVDTAEAGFERFYRPIDGTSFTPAMLTILLNLYFRLVPATMVATTPEVIDMAHRTQLTVDQVLEVLHTFLYVDPCAKSRTDDALAEFAPITRLCRETWRTHDDGNPMLVAEEAEKFLQYYI